MKIKRSELPESIAKALASRTFAQERPEDGQYIEANVGGGFERCRLEHRNDYLDCLRFDNGRHYTVLDKWSWKPILEIEDDAPEAKRELPEPKRGSYFILNDTLCLRVFTSGDWIITGQADGQIADPDTYQYRSISELPADWQPLYAVIARAARAEELEAELQVRNARIAELDEAIGAVEQTADEMADQCEKLQAKIKQQDAEHRDELSRAESRESRLLERINDAFNALGGEL